MQIRNSPVPAVLSVVLFLGWLAYAAGRPGEGRGGGTSQTRSTVGRTVDSTHTAATGPCLTPVRWRLGAIDPRFGLSAEEVTDAIESAISVWETSTPEVLFVRDETVGIPVGLRYDERQARTSAVMEADERLRTTWAAVDAERARLDREWSEFDEGRRTIEERMRTLSEEIERHRADVSRWNEGGGAPATVAEELEARGNRLRVARAELDEERTLYRSREAALFQAEAAYMEMVAAGHRQASSLEETFPPTAVSSGSYLRTVVRGPDGRSSVRPEIQVFRFADSAELIAILAHELGHALGLGHVDSPEAVMSARQDRLNRPAGMSRLSDADRELLGAHCDRLVLSSELSSPQGRR